MTTALFSDLSQQLLKDGACVRFQATGGSMRPFIRGGDTLTVEPADIKRAKIGEVVFCRHCGGFQAHRVIRRFKKDAFPALIVKGDALPGPGEIVFEEDFLGRVIEVERAGRQWPLDSALGSAANGAALFFSYFVFLTYPLLFFLKRSVRYFARVIVGNLQQAGWYRKGVRRWINRGILIDRLKEDDLYALACFYEYDRSPDFVELAAALKKDIVASGYLVAKKGRLIAGSVWVGPLFEESPQQDTWWITGLLVGWPYRGCGIAKMLIREACSVAVTAGAKVVRLYAFADKPHHLALYRSLGFERFHDAVIDGKMEQEASDTGRRRIPLEKAL